MVKTEHVYVRADCEGCFNWECVPTHVDSLAEREFLKGFYECTGCYHRLCLDCLEDTEGSCPECGGRLHKLTPKQIHECHTCLYSPQKSCSISECRYPDLRY